MISLNIIFGEARYLQSLEQLANLQQGNVQSGSVCLSYAADSNINACKDMERPDSPVRSRRITPRACRQHAPALSRTADLRSGPRCWYCDATRSRLWEVPAVLAALRRVSTEYFNATAVSELRTDLLQRQGCNCYAISLQQLLQTLHPGTYNRLLLHRNPMTILKYLPASQFVLGPDLEGNMIKDGKRNEKATNKFITGASFASQPLILTSVCKEEKVISLYLYSCAWHVRSEVKRWQQG